MANAGIKFTLESLEEEQKLSLYKEIFQIIPGTSNLWGKTPKEMTAEIYKFIEECACAKRNQKNVNNSEILESWKDSILPLLLKQKVTPEVKLIRDKLVSELALVGSIVTDDVQLDEKLEAICRNMLYFLFESLNKKEKEDFLTKVKTETAKKYEIELTKDQLNQAVIEALLTGAAGIPVMAAPAIAGIAVGYLANGWLLWLLTSFLGFFGINVAGIAGILTAIAGPIGWGVAGGAVVAGGLLAGLKYQGQRKEIIFVQSIFSIYSYKYQNSFKGLPNS